MLKAIGLRGTVSRPSAQEKVTCLISIAYNPLIRESLVCTHRYWRYCDLSRLYPRSLLPSVLCVQVGKVREDSCFL